MSNKYYDEAQVQDIIADISNKCRMPVLGAGGGFAPIGILGLYDGTVAPQGWLACDGTVYNISDYPELAAHYASHHGASNFYGGNGTTTFAVPDLRGEFLRGAGTNGHTNQGSGANVGVHQDGTLDNYVFGGDGYLITSNDGAHISNTDHSTKANTDVYIQGTSRSSTFDQTMSYTSRPTNTSFLICVRATVSGDANAHHYSTDEQIVGTWIDGSPIYERTITGLSTKVKYDDWVTITTIPSLKYIINAVAYSTGSTELKGGIVGCTEWFNDDGVVKCESLVNIDLRTINFVTIQYTKNS